MINEIRHIGIVVQNLKKAKEFYKNLLGFKIIKVKGESGEYIDKVLAMKNAAVKTVKMAAKNGNLIELLYFKSRPIRHNQKQKLYTRGYTHVAFGVEKIDLTYEKLKKKGVFFNSPPQVSPDGYAKVAFCRDPEGNFIELVEVLEKP